MTKQELETILFLDRWVRHEYYPLEDSESILPLYCWETNKYRLYFYRPSLLNGSITKILDLTREKAQRVFSSYQQTADFIWSEDEISRIQN